MIINILFAGNNMLNELLGLVGIGNGYIRYVLVLLFSVIIICLHR